MIKAIAPRFKSFKNEDMLKVIIIKMIMIIIRISNNDIYSTQMHNRQNRIKSVEIK